MKILPTRFQKYEFDEAEAAASRQVSPYFWAYLQNKIADYATAAIEVSYNSTEGNAAAIIAHERLKAQVEVLEELMQELTPPENHP